jgi:hypothetical protein
MSAGSHEATKTSESSIAFSEESSRPNQGTMANSAFWRDLEEQFKALQDTRLRGASGGNDFVCKRLNALIERGASKIAGADAPDLLGIWREALKKEGFDFHFSSESNEALDEAQPWQSISKSAIDWHCQTSATLCERLKARAKQAEVEEQFAQSGAKQSPTVTRTPHTRKRSSRKERRDAIRFLAIKQGLKGILYCRFLYEHKIGPPVEWVSDGCPTSYPEAYKKKPWRQKIQDEKYRAGIKLRCMEENKPEELKRLLGIASLATR